MKNLIQFKVARCGDDSRRSVSPLARLRSKEHISKVLEFGGVVEKPIVVGAQNPSGSKKTLSGNDKNMYDSCKSMKFCCLFLH